MFSDESKFNMVPSDDKQYVKRYKGEKFKPRRTVWALQGGGGRVMVWVVISVYGPGPLVRLQGRVNSCKSLQMLEQHFIDHFEKIPIENCILMQDNVPIHTAHTVKNFLQERNILSLDWSAQSPDLNPIENVWDNVKHQLRNENIINLYGNGGKIKEKRECLDDEGN